MARAARKRGGSGAAHQSPSPPPKYELPTREWDRATELIRLFVATGFISNARPQSMMLIAGPGSGKTELLERFLPNPQLKFQSDLTVRGLYQILRSAEKGVITHIFATEFQKYLMRKAATADNMLGTLSQALEEGVREVNIGGKDEDFGGAQVGVIGAITPTGLEKYKNTLMEIGFISRVAMFNWSMKDEEILGVMQSIGAGNASDLVPIHQQSPLRKIEVEMHETYSKHIMDYVWKHFRDHTVLRIFQRFRTLAMASAVMEGRKSVGNYDIERVFAFHDYWKIMKKG